MSLTLPGELVWVLDLLGYNWPEADEEALHRVAETWRGFGAQLEKIEAEGEGFARTVVAANVGSAIEGFSKDWGAYTGANGEDRYLPDAKLACEVIALAFDAAAIAVSRRSSPSSPSSSPWPSRSSRRRPRRRSPSGCPNSGRWARPRPPG
ncbi:hypothetical protein ACFW24_33390 [Streptomyces nigra]|uniref:WXG100-like domain-containing protein n=1 Tax=Streptomyces nigra TaxID=1827580 RepID=UPI0036853CA8